MLSTRNVRVAAVKTEEPLPIQNTFVNLTFLPLSTEAACLDGSPYAFYFVKSATGSTKWTIDLESDGWCYNEKQCALRAKTGLGTSKLVPPIGPRRGVAAT